MPIEARVAAVGDGVVHIAVRHLPAGVRAQAQEAHALPDVWPRGDGIDPHIGVAVLLQVAHAVEDPALDGGADLPALLRVHGPLEAGDGIGVVAPGLVQLAFVEGQDVGHGPAGGEGVARPARERGGGGVAGGVVGGVVQIRYRRRLAVGHLEGQQDGQALGCGAPVVGAGGARRRVGGIVVDGLVFADHVAGPGEPTQVALGRRIHEEAGLQAHQLAPVLHHHVALAVGATRFFQPSVEERDVGPALSVAVQEPAEDVAGGLRLVHQPSPVTKRAHPALPVVPDDAVAELEVETAGMVRAVHVFHPEALGQGAFQVAA